MQGPYREGGGDAPLVVSDTGLVDDVVRQFSDRYAFYRELVQNAIDAGSSQIHVHLAWAAGVMRISVRDDGEGMDRDVLENRLVVLFRSTKEGREDAIGKFGIGFVSVLALDPTLVEVKTTKGRGEGFVLQLHPDRSYELFSIQAGAASGTTVTLHVPCPAGEVEAFVEASRASITRWCRHASVPVRLVATVDGEAAPRVDARIDAPMDLPGARVSVTVVSDDGKTRAVVGLVDEPYGGFFNHGLTLYEDASPFGHVGFKVQDARLAHTLSRDNVRHDAAYEQALAMIAGRGRELLAEETANALRQARGSDYATIAALARASLRLRTSDWSFPLVDVVDGRGWATASEMAHTARFWAEGSSALTRALAAAGQRVAASEAAALLHALDIRSVQYARDVVTLVSPDGASDRDALLLSVVADLLDELRRRPSEIVLATLSGQHEGALFIAGGRRTEPWLVTSDEADDDPLRLVARPPLVLSARHPIVDKARRASDPVVAAILLTRAILVVHGLDDATDERLSSAALEKLGVIA